MTKLETDRYGVPQCDGDPATFEEYQERAWDLYHGRKGSDQLQMATPLHLRAGLTGTAYEAVRGLQHDKLKTKTTDGKPTDCGMKLMLQTLKVNIAAEAPVKVNELCLGAFYSSTVWRQPGETMQQYIVRREQDFKRSEDGRSRNLSDVRAGLPVVREDVEGHRKARCGGQGLVKIDRPGQVSCEAPGPGRLRQFLGA